MSFPHPNGGEGGVFIHAGELINGASIAQLAPRDAPETIRYFHVELERHGVILAEGAATESYVPFNNRHRFHNAASYAALYPEDDRVEAPFCAPLAESGPVADAVRLRLAIRAGLAGPSGAAAPGLLLGHLDVLTGTLAQGWALDAAHTDTPVCLEFYEHGRLIAAVLADRYRPDLARDGVAPQGRAGFSVALPHVAGAPAAGAPAAGMPATGPRTIVIRRATDGAVLGAQASASVAEDRRAA